jgi:type I restriction enzyme S subunit
MSAAARSGSDRVPFLRTSNVLWDEIDLAQVDEMSISSAELVAKSVRPGDLLVCEGGEIGRAAVWDGRVPVMSFQNHLHRLRPIDDDVDARFYVYFLQSAFTQLGIFEGAGNRTTIPNLSRNRLAALDVPHPPVHEQQSIARVLSKVREAVTVHERATETAVELKHAVMSNLFTRGLRGEAQQETEIGLVPQGWQVGPLENLAQFQRGLDITKSVQTNGVVPVISSGGIRSYHNVAAATGPGVVIGRKGSIGQLYYVESEYWPHDTTLWCTDFKGNLPKFVYYRLQTVDMKRLDSGAANPALNRNFLHAELVSWPGLAEQQSIVVTLDAIEEKIETHKKKRIVLVELYKSMLHKLMTGEISATAFDLSTLSPASITTEPATT